MAPSAKKVGPTEKKKHLEGHKMYLENKVTELKIKDHNGSGNHSNVVMNIINQI